MRLSRLYFLTGSDTPVRVYVAFLAIPGSFGGTPSGAEAVEYKLLLSSTFYERCVYWLHSVGHQRPCTMG